MLYYLIPISFDFTSFTTFWILFGIRFLKKHPLLKYKFHTAVWIQQLKHSYVDIYRNVIYTVVVTFQNLLLVRLL